MYIFQSSLNLLPHSQSKTLFYIMRFKAIDSLVVSKSQINPILLQSL